MSIFTSGPNHRDADAAPDFSAAPEPFALFEHWLADAGPREVNDPNAMTLATVDADGMPNVRMVLLKGLDSAERGSGRGFVFYTNFESTKGRELQAQPKAALLFHWKSLRRQVRVRGLVSVTGDAEADAYFATRARGSQLGAWASDQSRSLDARGTLERRLAEIEAKFADRPVPRPAHWSGFRVVPLEVEFWHDRPFRLHERTVFRRASADAAWQRAVLYP